MAGPAGGLGADLTNPLHFEQFVVTYSGVVETVCLRLLKDRYAAEDACQETFAAAWKHRSQLRPNRAWLLKVATNKCLDELRWRSRHRAQSMDEDGEGEAAYVASPAPSPEAVLLNGQAAEVLEHALSQLPWAQRLAIVLSDVEGWNYRQIAAACDVSIGTVKSRIFRARRTLRQLLAGQLFDEVTTGST
jgi:RNA polymerase sigma-70 factor (ECF subfamily)